MMEMNGGSAASYLARSPCVPVFLLTLIGLEAKGLLDFQGRRGITSVVRWNPRPVIFVVQACEWRKVNGGHYGFSPKKAGTGQFSHQQERRRDF